MMTTRKEKLIEELITRHGGDAIMMLPTGAGKTFIRKSLEDYDTDELRRKLDMIDEKPQVDKMTPAEFRRQYEQRFESDSHAATALRYASTGMRRTGGYLPPLPCGKTLYAKWQEECQKRLAEVMGLPQSHLTTSAAEPDDTVSIEQLQDMVAKIATLTAEPEDDVITRMYAVRDMFMAGNASIPQRCGGYLPPNDELPTVDWEARRHVNPLYVQMLGRALRPRNYTWRMTRGKQARKIKVWHKPKQRAITLDYNGEVVR